MKIHASINRMVNKEDSAIKAYASVTMDGMFAVHGLRVIETEKGRFVNMPSTSYTDKDGNTLTLIDVIADKSDIADEIDTKIKVEKLRVILPVCLTERERLIIEMRYGLFGREELTQREIAKKLNISRSYVSRIEKSALEKLRKQF